MTYQDSDKEFFQEKLRATLNFEPAPEQWDAITAPIGPGVIVAGAGTGKTTVMGLRIAWLVLTGQVDPDKILGLTFTNKAAAELKASVQSSIHAAKNIAATIKASNRPAGEESDSDSAEDLGEPTIATYNSFGSRLLTEHAVRLGLEPDAAVVINGVRNQIAAAVMRETSVPIYEIGQTFDYLYEQLLALDSNMANYLIEPEVLVEHERLRLEKFLQRDSSLDKTEEAKKFTAKLVKNTRARMHLAAIVGEFRAAKSQANIIDFTDQITLAAKIAIEFPEVGRQLREQYSVVLLDEYQDTSWAQMSMLKALFGEGHPVMSVGDPCQAIYVWRGAEVSNINEFKTEFYHVDESGERLSATTFTLTENRRSGQKILNAANDVSIPLRAVHDEIVALRSGIENMPEGSVDVAMFDSIYDELNWMADQIAQLEPQVSVMQDPKKPRGWSNVAVLTRKKNDVPLIVDALNRREIPCQVVDAEDLISAPEVRDVVSTLEVLNDPTANIALTRLLAGPRWAIGARDLAILGKQANDMAGSRTRDHNLDFNRRLDEIVAQNDFSTRLSLLDALENPGDPAKYKYSDEARVRFAALARELRELRRTVGSPLVDLVSRIIRLSGVGVEVNVRANVSGSREFDFLGAFLDLAGSFISIDGRSSLREFMTFLADSQRYKNQPKSELVIKDNAVVIMTIHKSKGLEFQFVALPFMTKTGFDANDPKTWLSYAQYLPESVLPTAKPELAAFCHRYAMTVADEKEYKSLLQAEALTEDTRLGYVAITRAKQHVFISGSYWNADGTTVSEPSWLLHNVREHATHDVQWKSASEFEKNPHLDSATPIVWGVPQTDRTAVRASAQVVRDLLESESTADTQADVSADEARELAALMKDTDVLIQAAIERASQVRTVKLPEALSPSNIMSLRKNPEAFIRSLVRPMPRKPSTTADRGTNFHLWVESFYAKRQLDLMDPMNLPGSGDADIYSDDVLDTFKETFKQGPFSSRQPDEIEFPFSLAVDGRAWPGRIDAVFPGTLDDPHAAGKWLIVDWKTGALGGADDIQLEIYRHAWAQARGVNIDDVHSAFYYISANEVVPGTLHVAPEDLPKLINEALDAYEAGLAAD